MTENINIIFNGQGNITIKNSNNVTQLSPFKAYSYPIDKLNSKIAMPINE